MLTRRSARRRVVTAVAALVTGGVMTATGPAHAIPVQSGPEPDRCERLLARAADWPGGGLRNTRLVSDGYVSFLTGSPDCADLSDR